jgi:predicted dehydrogenase
MTAPVMKGKRLRAAVIGLGFIGAGDQVSGDVIGQQVSDLDGTHSNALTSHPQVQLVTGSSRDEGRRRRFEKRHNIQKTYSDWREMLSVEKLDIVSVATNSPFHAAITVACAQAGVRAVLCEKPVATRLADADRAIRVCRERGVILAINHSRRWHPLWRAARDEIQQGTIGTPILAMGHWTTGRLGNVGTHVFDALCMLTGAKPAGVSGVLDPVVGKDCRGAQFHDPGGWGVVSFSNGINAFIHAPHAGSMPLVVRIVGSLGQLTIQGTALQVELWNGERRTHAAPRTAESSLDRAVTEIASCLTRGGQPCSTGEDGLAALEIIIGFHVSNRQHGQWVQIPISDTDRNLEVLSG